MTERKRGSVVDPKAPKEDQERQVEDEIEKDEDELFERPLDKVDGVPATSSDADYVRHPDLLPEDRRKD